MDTQPIPLTPAGSETETRLVTQIDDSANFQLVSKEFPHVGRRLSLLWGQPEFAVVADDLLTDKHGKERQGFPSHVLNALFALVQEHEKAFPQLKPKRGDFWQH